MSVFVFAAKRCILTHYRAFKTPSGVADWTPFALRFSVGVHGSLAKAREPPALLQVLGYEPSDLRISRSTTSVLHSEYPLVIRRHVVRELTSKMTSAPARSDCYHYLRSFGRSDGTDTLTSLGRQFAAVDVCGNDL